MGYILGIDGGGTKTRAALANENGKVIAQATVGATNLNSISNQLLIQTLEELFLSLKNQTRNVEFKYIHIFAGIAGAGNKTNRCRFIDVMKRIVTNTSQVHVETDPVNALYSGTYGKPGIVQISGTGSITYGINSKLQHDRVGGWGYFLGDEGSGYDIGRQGIMCALKTYDSKEDNTILLPNLFSFFKIVHPQELMKKIYSSPTPKNDIAAFAKIVLDAHKQKDSVAGEIITNVAKELATNIIMLYTKHFQKNEKTEVVLCGGVFSEEEILPRLIATRLQKLQKNLQVILPKMPPVGGSLIGAYLSQGKEPSQSVINNIIDTI
ncbi:N-acetylglucosamine kinase [Oceanobacillus chungangensis]|uniref:ATPase BadF/BadG/BcrA/BcrD type domain-containing protein n=1 Tax=Oceanobacillus chungangensis TaxID=1229152 RepID=A0A3D8PIY9_9BACI|nr:BadF/BadG/BcrA/BcrD ATPase family protein [Oceanobacillus chungangensis]RDW15622.1 hypothetical protein CWR45_17770 [Oceanobacillus chungangensis]